MSDIEKIKQLLCRFESAGLVERDIDGLIQCLSESILGIGLGEQGFVTSIEEVCRVMEEGIKSEDKAEYTLEYPRIEIKMPADNFGVVCAEVQINSHSKENDGKIIKSRIQQSLTVVREGEEWKICGLHASQPMVTEEDIEAYPLKFAEKTLSSLREKIGEQAYLAEEQYRKAVLADCVAFYIMNFSTDRIEKCQTHSDICAYAEPDTPYEEFIRENAPDYIWAEDVDDLLKKLSIKNIEEAFRAGDNEVTCTYRMNVPGADYIWAKTVIRLIVDAVSGDKKGIMYVKNIDEAMRRETEIQEKVEFDSMTKLLNKGTLIQKVSMILNQAEPNSGGVFLMLDVDDFKNVNDTFGHPTGDRVLMDIANLLRECFGVSALLGRVGGDEFCVFMSGTETDESIRERVCRLLGSVRRLRLREAPDFQISVSVGSVQLSRGSFEDFYNKADAALYEAKRAGKDKAVFY